MKPTDLFENYQSGTPISQQPDTAAIRGRLNAALRELRSASTFPWTPEQLKSWQHVFLNMAHWLPASERELLRHELREELDRWQSRSLRNGED